MTSLARPSLVRASLSLVALSVVSWLIGAVLQSRPLAGVLLGALAVDALATRVGAGWTWDERGRRDLALGALAGAVGALLAALGGVLTGQARGLAVTPEGVGMVTGVVAAVAGAVRDEIVLRWGPWRLLAPWAPAWVRAATAVGLGVAASVGAQGLRPSAWLVVGSLGVLSVAWIARTGSVVASIGAGALVRLLSNPTPLGLEVRWRRGTLAPLDAATGPGALWLAAALLVAAAVVWRGRPADEAQPPSERS